VQITCAISDNTQEIVKSGIELVLPCDGQRSGPLCIRFSSDQETSSNHTYTAVTKTDNRYLGRTTSGGMRVWRLMQIEYVDAALLAVTLKLNNTTRNLPNLPTGESIAWRSPPTLPPAYSAFQSGIKGADIAAAAPRHSIAICGWSDLPRSTWGISYCRNIEAKERISENSPTICT
jgi:hypothetical protein